MPLISLAALLTALLVHQIYMQTPHPLEQFLTFPIFPDYDSQIIFAYPSIRAVYLPQRFLFPRNRVNYVRSGLGVVSGIDN